MRHIPKEWLKNFSNYQVEHFPELWDKAVTEWNSENFNNSIWSMSASGYFVRSGKTFFAVDPVWLSPGAFEKLLPRLTEDLKNLRYIILTHDHADHFNPKHHTHLKELNIKWLVPTCMREAFLEAQIPQEKTVWLNDGDIFEDENIKVWAHLGMHHYLGTNNGPDSLMYFVETSEKRIFFPADARDFRLEFLPRHENIDATIFHVYLDLDFPDNYPFETFYMDVVKYLTEIDTKKLFFGHLYSFFSGANLWHYMHSGILKDAMTCLKPEVEVQDLMFAHRYEL
jgi:hypothetical protein